MALVSFTSRSITSAHEEHLSLARSKEEDGELGVFGAEKYFNRGMKPDIGAAKQHQQEQNKKEERSDTVQPIKAISTNHHPTPSIRSGSSWNSQSALLRNRSLNKAKKARGKSLLASLSCNCICSDKNSVDVVEEEAASTRSGLVHAKSIPKEHPIKTAIEVPTQPKEDVHVQKMDKLANGHNKESSLFLPNLSTPKMQFKLDLEDEQKARKSLEVFGSPVVDKRSRSLNIESMLAELVREVDPRMLEEETEVAQNDNESGSDASSDLFEIESLTSKPNPFLAVQGSGCVTPTTCYAPSEASIEWSVITASAVDLDFEDQRPKTKSTVQKRHPKILLSCKSHKSVRVAGDAYIARDKVHDDHSPRTGHISIPISPVTRFQGGNKMTSFDSKQEHGLAKHKLNRSRSPRASHILYIQ